MTRDSGTGFWVTMAFAAGAAGCLLLISLAISLQDTLKAFQAWQTLIAGLLGFAGLAWTLWFNAGLERQRKDDERAHERSVLQAALTAELEQNLDSYRDNLMKVADRESRDVDVLVPTRARVDVYNRLLDRIGLLDPSQVAAVLAAYGMLDSHADRLKVAVRVLAAEEPEKIEGQILIPAKVLPVLKSYLSATIEKMQAALRALSA